jgi:hypothetical protein
MRPEQQQQPVATLTTTRTATVANTSDTNHNANRELPECVGCLFTPQSPGNCELRVRNPIYDFRPPVLALSTSHRKSAGNCEPHVLLCRKLLATVSFKLLPPRCHPRPGPRSRASPVFPANEDLRFQPLLIDYRRTALILPMQEQLWQTSDDHVTTHIVVPDR